MGIHLTEGLLIIHSTIGCWYKKDPKLRYRHSFFESFFNSINQNLKLLVNDPIPSNSININEPCICVFMVFQNIYM